MTGVQPDFEPALREDTLSCELHSSGGVTLPAHLVEEDKISHPRWLCDQWHASSTGNVERYEMVLRDAHGGVVRLYVDGAGYSAYIGCEGRQQWAKQQFDD